MTKHHIDFNHMWCCYIADFNFAETAYDQVIKLLESQSIPHSSQVFFNLNLYSICENHDHK